MKYFYLILCKVIVALHWIFDKGKMNIVMTIGKFNHINKECCVTIVEAHLKPIWVQLLGHGRQVLNIYH